MKTVNTIVKILTALAAIAGAVYIIATYGDQIVAWAKKLLASCPCRGADVEIEEEAAVEETAEEPIEEPAEEAAEEPVEEVVVEEHEPVADEADFAE